MWSLKSEVVGCIHGTDSVPHGRSYRRESIDFAGYTVGLLAIKQGAKMPKNYSELRLLPVASTFKGLPWLQKITWKELQQGRGWGGCWNSRLEKVVRTDMEKWKESWYSEAKWTGMASCWDLREETRMVCVRSRFLDSGPTPWQWGVIGRGVSL